MGPPEMWTERAAIVREQGIDPLVDAALERWFTPEAPPAAVATAEAMLRSMDTEGYAGGCEALATHDLRGRLGAIRAPTLAVAGAGDPAAPPEHLEAIRDEIPGARLEIVEGARHLANLERPDEITRIVLGFLGDGGG
jgi:3-oxoadipate enol-lactonase